MHILLSLDFCTLLESKEYIHSVTFLANCVDELIDIQQTCAGPSLCLDNSTRDGEKETHRKRESSLTLKIRCCCCGENI